MTLVSEDPPAPCSAPGWEARSNPIQYLVLSSPCQCECCSLGVLTYDTCSASITGGRGAASSCTFLDTVLGTFTKWDSAQFLAIADSMWDTAIGRGHAFDGYTSEASHAFLPLFPAIVRVTVSVLLFASTDLTVPIGLSDDFHLSH